jgi:hypothetical protein
MNKARIFFLLVAVVLAVGQIATVQPLGMFDGHS